MREKQSIKRDTVDMSFADKAVDGIFMGYHLGAGCRWKGEYEAAFSKLLRNTIINEKCYN